jgi:hypothetical protein
MSGAILITSPIRLWTGKKFLTVNELPTHNTTFYCILNDIHLFNHTNFTLQYSPRCTVWTVNSLHVAGLGALYGHLIIYVLLASVHGMVMNAFQNTFKFNPLAY